MMMRLRIARRVIPALVLVCLAAFVAAPAMVDAQTTPHKATDAEKQQIKQAMDHGDSFEARYDECVANAVVALLTGNFDLARAWLDAAEAWQAAITAWRNLVITFVDLFYGITAPPNATIEYDPNSRGYGATSGDKTHQRVRLCPLAFSDGPGLVASVKIHELTHAWQIHSCMSSQPGYWIDCSFWWHFSEMLAYLAEEEAYDAGITDDMPPEEKELVKERILNHLRAMLDDLFSHWFESLFHVFAGDTVTLPFFVYNPTAEPQTVTVMITAEYGWPLMYDANPIVLEPEASLNLEAVLQVPDDVETGTVNRITLVVESDSGAMSTEDTAFVRVVPRISVEAVGETQGVRGQIVEVPFVVTSSYDVPTEVMLQATNPLGWPIDPPILTLMLAPGEQVEAMFQTMVDPGAEPLATNLVFCDAIPVEEPDASDRAWAAVAVADVDVGALAITQPYGEVPVGSVVNMEAWIKSTGRVASWANVELEIQHEDGTPLTSEAIFVPMLDPGETVPVIGSPVIMEEPGCYRAVVSTHHPEDAEPANDIYSVRFDVVDAVKAAAEPSATGPAPKATAE